MKIFKRRLFNPKSNSGKKIKKYAQIFMLCFVLSVLSFVWSIGFKVALGAWTEPTASPPNGNIPAPLNIGPNDQAKEGKLAIGTTDLPDSTSKTLEVVGDTDISGILTAGTVQVGDCSGTCVDISSSQIAVGISSDTSGIAIKAYSDSNSGIYGQTESDEEAGVSGFSMSGYGVYGYSRAEYKAGVYGLSDNSSGWGVFGYNTATSGTSDGVRGFALSPGGRGVCGVTMETTGYGVYGENNADPVGYAGYFHGKLGTDNDFNVDGNTILGSTSATTTVKVLGNLIISGGSSKSGNCSPNGLITYGSDNGKDYIYVCVNDSWKRAELN